MYLISELNQLPLRPGIYKMYCKRNTIIYIGKAKVLKKRVKQYFTGDKKDYKTSILVSQIHHISIIETETEKEALLLENQLIKLHKPKYNILLKDDKTFPYIKLTRNEPFPKLVVTRQKRNDGAQYYGPYPSIGSSKALRNTLYALFPIRDCKQAITLTETQPKCMLLDIGRCIGPCVYKTIKKDYDILINQIHTLLTGKDTTLLTSLRQQMMTYSKNRNYEQAAVIRDRIHHINDLVEKQRVCMDAEDTYQLWAFSQDQTFYYLLIQEVIKGKLIAQHGFYCKEDSVISENDFIEQTYINFRSQYATIPDELICSNSLAAIIQSLSQSGFQQTVLVPKRGIKKELLANAQRNANFSVARLTIKNIKSTVSNKEILENLKLHLSLLKTPYHIFGFDCSHLQGQDIVASAVCFTNGMPNASEYRTFKIKSVKIQSNDPVSIQEAVYRRLNQCFKNKDRLPDLIIVDGGKAQLNFAHEALKVLGLEKEVELIALAKKHEEIYSMKYDHPMRLPKQDQSLQLIQRIRDESHRFALTFQRKQRGKRMKESQLQSIKGLGKSRINLLYQRFDAIEDIAKANVEELAQIPTIGMRLANQILQSLNQQH